jgi:hypothetical protein
VLLSLSTRDWIESAFDAANLFCSFLERLQHSLIARYSAIWPSRWLRHLSFGEACRGRSSFWDSHTTTDGAPGHEHLILKRQCFLRARAMPKDARHRAASPSSRAVTTRTSTTNTCPTVPRCLPTGRRILYHLCPLRTNNTSTSNILPRRRIHTLRANPSTMAAVL